METASPAPFAELLRRHRLALGLTQEELAERAGLSPNAVSDLERSRRRAPYQATMDALVSALGLTPEDQRALEASVVRRRRPLVKPSELPHRDVSALLAEVVRFSDSGDGGRLRLELPLVGREKELAALLTDYESARQGEVRLAVLEGEAGMGKTRLAESFLRWAEKSGSDVLRGAALETAAALPYHSIVDAIRARLARDDLRQGLIPEVWRAELARLLPELNEYTALPEAARAAQAEGGPQAWLFEAVAQLTLALLSPLNAGPLILFLDDVQWTDTASRDLLQYLLRRWQEEKAGVLLLLAVRTESTQDPVLMPWLVNLWRSDSPSRIFLSPLNPSETLAALEWMAVAETLGSEASANGGSLRLRDLAGWLQTRTAGHPLYLTEMVRVLRDHGVIELRPDGGLEVTAAWDEMGSLQTILPATVRALIRSRLAGLDRRASDILVAISVLGEEAGLEVVLRVAAFEEIEAIQAIDLLAQRRVLVETEAPASAGIRHVGYRIAHDLIREVVYGEAGEARRRLFHRRSLTELEALRAPAAELLRHALAASLPQQAFRYAVAAGDDALDVFAPEDGIRHFETARHLLTEHGLRTVAEAVEDSVPDHRSLADREVEHLMHQLARAYEWIGDWPRATAAYHDLLAHARGADLVELEAQCLIRLSWIVWAESADVVEASRFAAEALGKLGASGNEGLRAEAYRQLASMTLVGSAPHEAIGHAVQAIELAHVAGAIEIEAQAYLASGWASLQAGEWDESVASLESALRLFERLTKADERAGAAARPIPAATLRPGSRPIGWSPWGGPSAGASFEVTRGNCLAAMASVEVCRGNAARAVELGSDALRVARATRDALSEIQACLYYSVALLEAGTLEAGLVMVREGVRIARLGGERGIILLALNSLATAGLTLLHLDEAKATADEAVQIAKQTGSSLQLLRALSSVCARAVLIEHWAEAASAANEAFAIRTSVTNPFTFFDFHLHREVEALLHYDQQSSARELVRLIDERTANDESQRRMRLVCLRMKAALYRWERDEAGATRESEQALELAQSLSLPGESWQIAAELAGSYTLAGERMKAAEMLKVAGKTVDALAHDISDSALRKSFRSSASALISASVG